MIDHKTLKQLVLEVYSANPSTPVQKAITDVERLAAYHNVFPSKKENRWYNISHQYYGRKKLSPVDKRNVTYIIWHLIRETLLVIDKDRLN